MRRGASRVGVALLAVASLAGPAAGQTIEADRPGLLYAGSVLGPGRAQLELGTPQLAWGGGESEEARLLNFPSALRVGLGAGLELQVGHSLVNRLRVTAPGRARTETGLGDLGLGLKLARAGAGSRPGLVVVASVGLPTGEAPFTSGDPVLGLQAQAGWTVGGGLSLAALAGVGRSAGDGPEVEGGTLAVSLGVPMGGAWSVYAEAGYFPDFRGVDTGTLGAGVARIVGERVQLDAALNRGLGESAADWSGGVGVSLLLW